MPSIESTKQGFAACLGKRLLVVDDDPANREIVLDLLEQSLPEMEVLLAKDGLQALEVLAKHPVDVILLDWEMPRMNGLEFLQHRREYQVHEQIPVVLYTGAMTQSGHLAQGLEAGAVDFLRKPADETELLARLNAILYQKDLERARQAAEQLLLRQEITLLQQEVNQQIILLAQKNEALSGIRQTCEDLARRREITPLSLAQSIGRMLEQDDYWESLLDKFRRTDPLFIQKLHQLQEPLSPAELRLSVLIRLGIDNKTIAHLLQISAEGVKKSRYRLRKKLQIEGEDNLDSYIQTI